MPYFEKGAGEKLYIYFFKCKFNKSRNVSFSKESFKHGLTWKRTQHFLCAQHCNIIGCSPLLPHWIFPELQDRCYPILREGNCNASQATYSKMLRHDPERHHTPQHPSSWLVRDLSGSEWQTQQAGYIEKSIKRNLIHQGPSCKASTCTE